MRFLHRTAVVGVVTAGALAGLAGTSQAAAPAVPNCVGKTFVTASQTMPPGTIGHFVSSGATDPSSGQPIGFGDNIAFLRAGGVLDSMVPNTCN
jgi:hypothetical protein